MKAFSTLILLFTFFMVNAQKGELIVRIENIKSIKGSMKIAVYDRKDLFLSDSVVLIGNQKIETVNVEFVFRDLPEGSYALSIFHDENDNGKLDSNFMGIPSEPYAFSNNAKGAFGPPKFEDCLVEVVGHKKITITL